MKVRRHNMPQEEIWKKIVQPPCFGDFGSKENCELAKRYHASCPYNVECFEKKLNAIHEQELKLWGTLRKRKQRPLSRMPSI